jgi:hypothetical protein
MNWPSYASLAALPTSNTILHKASAVSVQLAMLLLPRRFARRVLLTAHHAHLVPAQIQCSAQAALMDMN